MIVNLGLCINSSSRQSGWNVRDNILRLRNKCLRQAGDDFCADLFTSKSFLLIVCTRHIVTDWLTDGSLLSQSVVRDTQMFQHIARFYNGHGSW
jgi:hypothetical protein